MPPLKPCLKRPVNLSLADKMYQNRKLNSTPSAFQPFSTIAEDQLWEPYSGHRPSTALGLERTSRNQRDPTQFRSEISRFTESLYNLAKPTPVKPLGMFPRVRDSHHSNNINSILNPSLPMKPIQNLDEINPFTGLPNIEFIPTTEYLGGAGGSSYLPDWTPSPDSTARRVAAILEPQHTYSQLVHDLNAQKRDQHRLQMLEQQMRNFSFQPPPPAPAPVVPDYQFVPVTTPAPAGYHYVQPQGVDPTFLGNPNHLATNTNAYQHVYPAPYQPVYTNNYVPTNIQYADPIYTYSNTANTIAPVHSVPPVNSLPFDQQQLDQAWAQLSTEIHHSQPSSNYRRPRSAGSLPVKQQPLQGVLDMISIDRISNISKPVNHSADSTSTSTMNNFYKTCDKRQRKLESTYEDLLALPKMARSPSEVEPLPSSEDELSRYNERRRQNIFTLMNRGRDGNVDLKKHQLSQKYQEAKYVENRILGHVPSVLQDLQKLDLNKKLNEKNKEIDKTLRQISRSYEDRCKQREKMRSALSLVKEIPKMEFDQYNNLIAKADTTLLSNVKRSKNSNTIKMDDMEFEVSDEIMSMIYHRALKKRMESKSSKQKNLERRRSKTKMIERSQESSSEPEIADIMKNEIFKQKVEDFDRDLNRESQLKCLQRYSPRLLTPLLPVLEDKLQEVVRNVDGRKKDDVRSQANRDKNAIPNDLKLEKSKTQIPDLKELKFLLSEDPVPSPAPLEKHQDDIRIERKSEHTFVKSKSSSEFKSLPRAKPSQRRGSFDRRIEGVQDVVEVKKPNINISKTAKKHLGMAETPVGLKVKQTELDQMFQTIGNSYEGGSNSDSSKQENSLGNKSRFTSPPKINSIDQNEVNKNQTGNFENGDSVKKYSAEKLGSKILYKL